MKVKDALKVVNKLEAEIKEGKDTIAKVKYHGLTITRTQIPHKSGELKGKLRHFIRQQLKLNENDFRAIAICTKDRNDYIKILRQKGLIT